MNNEALKAEYVELLKTIDTSYLDVRNKRIGGPKGLSGLFLASVAEGYSQAKNVTTQASSKPKKVLFNIEGPG
jgi:hypothetical protein